MRVYVYVRSREEQLQVCSFLAERKYFWKSGRMADDIPTLLVLKQESKGMIIALDTEKQEIGYFPAEIYGSAECLPETVKNNCITADDLYENLK